MNIPDFPLPSALEGLEIDLAVSGQARNALLGFLRRLQSFDLHDAKLREFLASITQLAMSCRVEIHEPSGGRINNQDAVRRLLEQGAESLLAFSEPTLGLLAFGYVMYCTAHQYRLARPVANDFRKCMDDFLAIVGKQNSVVQIVVPCSAQGITQGLVHAGFVLGMNPVKERLPVLLQVAGIHSENLESLLGPLRRVGRHIPFPGTDMSDALRGCQVRLTSL